MLSKKLRRLLKTSAIRNPDLHGVLWNWKAVADALPGRVGVTDIDGIIERRGQFIVLETKRIGESLPLGQRIMLKALARQSNFTVYVLTGEPSSGEIVAVHQVNRHGDLEPTNIEGSNQLADAMKDWYEVNS